MITYTVNHKSPCTDPHPDPLPHWAEVKTLAVGRVGAPVLEQRELDQHLPHLAALGEDVVETVHHTGHDELVHGRDRRPHYAGQ